MKIALLTLCIGASTLSLPQATLAEQPAISQTATAPKPMIVASISFEILHK
jgi:hypothetical protein